MGGREVGFAGIRPNLTSRPRLWQCQIDILEELGRVGCTWHSLPLCPGQRRSRQTRPPSRDSRPYKCSNALGAAQLEIMRAQAKTGDLAGALSEAAKLRAPGMQVDALIGIAKGLLEVSSASGSTSSQDRVH